ncbi:MAG: protein phosphatase CheZ [Desulfobaccales bacterium]
MTGGKRIELSLGREPGEFTLSLDDMAITIHMNTKKAGEGASDSPKRSPEPAAQTSPEPLSALSKAESQDIERLMSELDRYQQVSREIYEGLGKLAKDINLSIQDLSLAELIQTSLGSPCEHLDQARNQVTDVLLMTEQATLSIMDLVEEIREDCQTVHTRLLSMTQTRELPGGKEPAPEPAFSEEEEKLWDTILAQAQEFDRIVEGGNFEAAATGPGAPSFSLSDILQIIFEFCTNEKVKQHLKAVQSKQEGVFVTHELEQALNLLAAGAPQEGGFYQLPLAQVLEILKSHCEDERIKDLFTKMAASADKLFPVTALPLEAKEPADDFSEEPPDLEGKSEIFTRWQELRHSLALLREHRQAEVHGGGAGRQSGMADVQMVLDTVDHITKNLSRIIEALSFQDLSGQRLLKILKIIRQLQVQVLTLLVAAGERLQDQIPGQALGSKESDQAREELDRLLTGIAPSASQSAEVAADNQPLDQNAINELLTTMGF